MTYWSTTAVTQTAEYQTLASSSVAGKEFVGNITQHPGLGQSGVHCTPPATRAAPCLAEMCAILSRLGKLKDLSQIDGVVPVFGLLLTTPLIISKNKQLHSTFRRLDDARSDVKLSQDSLRGEEEENVFECLVLSVVLYC